MNLNSLVTLNNSNSKYHTSFKAEPAKIPTNNMINTLSAGEKVLANFIRIKENDEGLSHVRFIQDVSTNWIPKAIFARSKADFADMSFLEFTESALFYYAPALLGQHLLRPLFSKLLKPELRDHIVSSVKELENNPTLKEVEAKKIIPLKAAIVLACAFIPASEYVLPFVKNLFTLKYFKKADFGNIANLNQNQKEDPKQQEKVKRSAAKHIKTAAIISLAGIAGSILLAVFGHKFEPLQKLSKVILNPGERLATFLEKNFNLKSANLRKNLETYANLDFNAKTDSKNKKVLSLSHGQLTFTVISGVAGYLAAAKDRGILDYLEVLTRVPFIVAPYTIFGSCLFEKYFKNYLLSHNKYPDLIKKDENNEIKVEDFDKLTTIAKGDTGKWRKLFKDKAKITLIPFLFSMVVVGGTVAAISRLWTQYRYNHGIGRKTGKKLNIFQ